MSNSHIPQPLTGSVTATESAPSKAPAESAESAESAEIGEITDLLRSWSAGDADAFEDVLPLVYSHLRRIAAHCLAGERSDHTLQPTALAHEAYLRLLRQQSRSWRDRSHFLGVASTAMRRILVDHARSRRRLKRGGIQRTLRLEDTGEPAIEPEQDLLALDQALERLGSFDSDLVKLVELRFFGGLSVEETAGVLGVTPRTIRRRWLTAKLWLYRDLTASPEPQSCTHSQHRYST